MSVKTNGVDEKELNDIYMHLVALRWTNTWISTALIELKHSESIDDYYIRHEETKAAS